MTQTASMPGDPTVGNVVNMVPSYYDQWGTGTSTLTWCPVCQTYYVPSAVPHTCFPNWNYTPPPADPFKEFKALYRKLITDEVIRQFKVAMDDHYKDSIDKPTRKDLIEYVESIAQDIVHDEPTP